MFAQRLKELRKLNGLSQATLSSLLGVTQQAVGKWETGRSTPDPQTLARVAAYFKVSTDYLLGVVIFGEGEGTLKKFIRRGNTIILQPFNNVYVPQIIMGEDLEHLYIAGKVVETRARW